MHGYQAASMQLGVNVSPLTLQKFVAVSPIRSFQVVFCSKLCKKPLLSSPTPHKNLSAKHYVHPTLERHEAANHRLEPDDLFNCVPSEARSSLAETQCQYLWQQAAKVPVCNKRGLRIKSSSANWMRSLAVSLRRNNENQPQTLHTNDTSRQKKWHEFPQTPYDKR